MRFTKWTAVRVLALALTVAFVWALNFDRLSPDTWAVPVDYHEDSLMVMSWIKSAQDGDFIPFLSKDISRLGAPYTGNWNDWPVWGEEVIFSLGLLARLFGLFAAANLGVLLGYVTSALAFYACCRLLRFRRLWSFVGAVLFAFTYFHSYRFLHHLMHTYSYMVPFGILTGWLIAFSKRLRWGGKFSWICLATAAVTGLTNPYNLNMFGQMLCLGLGFQLLTRRRKPNLQIGAACLAIIVVGFLAINLDTFGHGWTHGKNPDVLVRGYYETELFALKPMELFVPPVAHKATAFAQAGSKYAREAWIKGEMFSPYLGVVGIAGLLWLAAHTFLTLLKSRKAKGRGRLPAYAPTALWVLGYATVGGLNCLIALATMPLFRGSNRYSIFISALVLLFMVSRASVLARRWSREKQILAAGMILLVGLFDQLPKATTREETSMIARGIRVDRAFTEAMEGKLPPQAMVFQLPVVPYPEPPGIDPGRAYEQFRPYFYSKTMRFSYGSNKGRPREDWQKEVEKMPGEQMAPTLERYGFAAIYVNRNWLPDRAEGLLKQLAAAGRGEILEDEAREQVCVLLKPSATPELPPPGDRVPLVFGRGWVASVANPAGQQHWAGNVASLKFFHPSTSLTSSYSLNCQVASLSPRRVSLHLNGREIWSAELGASQLAPVNLRLDARSGYNHLEFASDVREIPSKDNPVPRTFVVIAPRIVRAGQVR